MIISRITGGLGNQIFQYAVGKAVSLKHDVPLKLDITSFENYELHNGYRLDQFNVDSEIASLGEIERLKGKDNLHNKIIRRIGIKKSYLRERINNLYQSSVFLRDTVYLDGYWQNAQYFNNIQSVIIQDMQLKGSISANAEKFRLQMLTCNSVGVHVRRGDYLQNSHIGVLDISYYKNAVRIIEEKIKDPVFYIFSNDMDWCRENFKFIRNIVFVDDTESEIDDFILQSECDHNIIANSSFSWWTAWLNKNENKCIIAPKKWMVEDRKNCRWALDDWIEV